MPPCPRTGRCLPQTQGTFSTVSPNDRTSVLERPIKRKGSAARFSLRQHGLWWLCFEQAVQTGALIHGGLIKCIKF
jgi:hypothetical protein